MEQSPTATTLDRPLVAGLLPLLNQPYLLLASPTTYPRVGIFLSFNSG